MKPVELHSTRFYQYKLNPYRLTEKEKMSRRGYIDVLTCFNQNASKIICGNNYYQDHDEIRQKHLIETTKLQNELNSLLSELEMVNLKLANWRITSSHCTTIEKHDRNFMTCDKKKKRPSNELKNKNISKNWDKRYTKNQRGQNNSSLEPKDEPCIFYQRKKCAKEKSCSYKHKKLCFFYNNSICKNGESCNFMHWSIDCKFGGKCTAWYCPFKHDKEFKRKEKRTVLKESIK